MDNYTATDISQLQSYTQEELNNELHYAILEYNYHNIKVLVSSPHLSLHADIYSKTEDEEIWSYMYLRSPKMQDYLMSFDYITDPQEKINAIKNVCVAVSHYGNTYSLSKLIESHVNVLDSETLNEALLHAIKNDSPAIDALLKVKIDNHVWNNADALVAALLSGSRTTPQKILHNPSQGTHSTEALKEMYNVEITVWLENMLLHLQPAPDFKSVVDMDKLYEHIAKNGNSKLLHLFANPNQYDVMISPEHENILLKKAILNENYDFISELMHDYQCFVDQEIKSDIVFSAMLLNKPIHETLHKVKEIQDTIQLKLQLEKDLPKPASKSIKRKI